MVDIIRGTLARPGAVYRVLVPCLVGFFLVSAVGGDRTASDGGLYYVGAAGWVLFFLTLIATIVFTVVIVVGRLFGRTATR